MSQAVIGAVVGIASGGLSYAGAVANAEAVRRRIQIAMGRVWRQGKANVPVPEGATSLPVTFENFNEFDANYLVFVTPQWNTTVWITDKKTTGFTINFGTAAPAGGSALDWATLRFFKDVMQECRRIMKEEKIEEWAGEWKG
ncbi:MAG: hypothetical protein QXK47_04065 [Candidatus Bathyarchaeia archaeon]